MLTPIGRFLVPAAGTPVRLTSTQPDPSAPFACHGIFIQALPANAGKVYVGTSALNKTTLAGVIGIIAIPTDNSIPAFTAALTLAPNAINLADLYLDVETSGEGAIVSVLIA
jgi:hypothetical protein